MAVPPVVAAQPRRPAAQVQHLQGIASDVAAFSLMTYDYSGVPGEPGPNAPLSWQRENIQLLRQPPAKGTKGTAGACSSAGAGWTCSGSRSSAPAEVCGQVGERCCSRCTLTRLLRLAARSVRAAPGIARCGACSQSLPRRC